MSGVVTADGGDGVDTASIAVRNAYQNVVTVTESDGAFIFDNGQTHVVARNFEKFRVSGSSEDAPGVVVDATAVSSAIDFVTTTAADTIFGSTGSNIFYFSTANAGRDDLLTGAGGADTFRFSVFQALGGLRILDLSADDHLDFSTIQQPSTFIGAAQFTGVAGQYRSYVFDDKTYVAVDTNGDSVADQVATIDGRFLLAETASGSDLLKIAGAVAPASPAADTISGGSGSDALEGSAGNDRLSGNGGADLIAGGGMVPIS